MTFPNPKRCLSLTLTDDPGGSEGGFPPLPLSEGFPEGRSPPLTSQGERGGECGESGNSERFDGGEKMIIEREQQVVRDGPPGFTVCEYCGASNPGAVCDLCGRRQRSKEDSSRCRNS